MNHLDVYDKNGRRIGWLILYNQQYYPYTMDGESLPVEFFNHATAEAFLQDYVATQEAESKQLLEEVETGAGPNVISAKHPA